MQNLILILNLKQVFDVLVFPQDLNLKIFYGKSLQQGVKSEKSRHLLTMAVSVADGSLARRVCQVLC